MPCVYDDVPGSWATQSEGWPSIDDPGEVARMLVIKNKLVPYGSYVTVDGRLRLETPEYVERVRAALEAATPNPVRAEQQGLGAGGRYWRERAEFWRAQAVALGWREVRDAANGEQPEGKGAYTLPPDTGPFADWLAREMPAGTVISNPHWWAPRILRQIAMLAAAPGAAVGSLLPREALYGALRELVRRIEVCGASPELTNASSLACDLMDTVGNQFNPPRPDAVARVTAALAATPVQKCPHPGCEFTDGKPCAYAHCPNAKAVQA